MDEKRIIIRGDDCGANPSSTMGIWQCVETGLLKNVSFMAAGTDIEEAATLFQGRKDICMGMHFTIFSEWERIKWHHLSPVNKISTLLDATGEFYSGPKRWEGKNFPDIEEVYQEWNAQLDFLTALGLNICYGDTHMFPELYWEELYAAMEGWFYKKGLLNHWDYYNPLPEMKKLPKKPELLDNLKPGQYFYLLHPMSDKGEDRALCGNREISAEELAIERMEECRFLTSEKTKEQWFREGINSITYKEAEILKKEERCKNWPNM